VTALSPLDPDTRFALCGLAMIHIIRVKYELALARAGHALAVNQHYDATYWMLVAANAHLGRMAEAKRHLASLRQLAPNISLSSIRAGQPAMIHGRIEPILDGLRLAGLEF
jgi:Flp pilus assembly protein TadD